MIAPSMVLEGAAPEEGEALAPATHKDLQARLGAGKGAKMTFAAADLFGEKVVNVLHTREIPLGSIDKDLKGVVCVVHEPVNIGASGGRATVMGAMPHPEDTEKEVMEFVKVLLEHDRIDLDKKKSNGDSRKRHGRQEVRPPRTPSRTSRCLSASASTAAAATTKGTKSPCARACVGLADLSPTYEWHGRPVSPVFRRFARCVPGSPHQDFTFFGCRSGEAAALQTWSCSF